MSVQGTWEVILDKLIEELQSERKRQPSPDWDRLIRAGQALLTVAIGEQILAHLREKL